MALVVIFIAAVLITTALRNSQRDLAAALSTDVPPFLVWGAAILAIGAIGYVPGLKGPSRALMTLVLTVIVLTNYKAVIAGFQAAGAAVPPTTPPDTPAQGVAATAAAAGVNWAGSMPGPLGWIPGIANAISGAVIGAAAGGSTSSGGTGGGSANVDTTSGF